MAASYIQRKNRIERQVRKCRLNYDKCGGRGGVCCSALLRSTLRCKRPGGAHPALSCLCFIFMQIGLDYIPMIWDRSDKYWRDYLRSRVKRRVIVFRFCLICECSLSDRKAAALVTPFTFGATTHVADGCYVARTA